MAEWTITTLEACTDILGDGLHGTPIYSENGEYAFVNGNNLVDGEILIKKDTKKVDESQYEKYKKTLSNRTILVSINGTLGNVGTYNSEKIILGKSACYFNVKNSVDKDFIYYVVSSPAFRQYLESNATGTTIKNISLKQMREYSFAMPSYDEQQRISSILKTIDRKIKGNKEINKNLLQQLHVLYLRLFCDSAMDTPLGDVVATTSGGTPSRKHDEYYSDSSICWVKSKELIGNYIHETEEHINDLAIKKSSAKLLPEHSVLIAMYGATVGAYGVISKPMTCNQAVCALLCNENYPYTYLFQIAYESQQKFINLAVGSAQQNISQVLIKQLNLHSDLDIIQRFHDLALPMHQEIEFLQAENMRLSALRDNLLPKLMSGELDVSDIEL